MNIRDLLHRPPVARIFKILNRSVFFLMCTSAVQAQMLFGGFMVGGANYQGELQDKYFTLRGVSTAVGISSLYAFNDRFSISGEFLRGTLTGSDASPDGRNRARNLHFVTRLYELSFAGRINVFNSPEIPFIPYVLGGGSVFHIDPFTPDAAGGKVYLFPLSTEGQGLNEYPDRPLNKRVNVALFGGGGIEFRVTKKLRVDFEVAFRKSFTDYIDDVSTTYPNPNLLYAAHGPQAVQYSFRGDEVSSGDPVFPAGAQRGNPGTDDWFHVVSIRFRYPIFDRALEMDFPRYLFRKRGWPYHN